MLITPYLINNEIVLESTSFLIFTSHISSVNVLSNGPEPELSLNMDDGKSIGFKQKSIKTPKEFLLYLYNCYIELENKA